MSTGRWKKHLTHCKRGHPFNADNTVIKIKKSTGKPERQCRECARMRHMGARYANAPKVFGRLRGLGKKYCQHGHRLTAENMIMRRDGEATYVECRDCRKEAIRKFDLTKIKDNITSLVAFVRDGGTITQARHNGTMTQRSWEAVMAQQPRLAARLKKISRVNFGANMSRTYWQAHAPNIIVRRRHSDSEIMDAANRAVPHGIADRLDVVSMMVLAHLDGKLPLRSMAQQWTEFRKEHVKLISPRFNPLAHDRQRHLPVLSMEGTMIGAQDSDGVPLGTTLSNGFWQSSLNPEEILIMRQGES